MLENLFISFFKFLMTLFRASGGVLDGLIMNIDEDLGYSRGFQMSLGNFYPSALGSFSLISIRKYPKAFFIYSS